eukprot:m.98348 g.98348  ORF g.98348 m.98348 type:complete len:428 (-) comp16743_c0_seq2:66-1349(-)
MSGFSQVYKSRSFLTKLAFVYPILTQKLTGSSFTAFSPNDTLPLLTDFVRDDYPLVRCNEFINLTASTDYVTYVQFYSPYPSRYSFRTCQTHRGADGLPADTILFFNGTEYDDDTCGSPGQFFEETMNVTLPRVGYAVVGVGLFWDNRTLPALLWISCPLDSAPPTLAPTDVPSSISPTALPSRTPSTSVPSTSPTPSPMSAPISISPTAPVLDPAEPQSSTETSSSMDPVVIVAIAVALILVIVSAVYFRRYPPSCATDDKKMSMQAIDGVDDVMLSHTMFTNPMMNESDAVPSTKDSKGGSRAESGVPSYPFFHDSNAHGTVAGSTSARYHNTQESNAYYGGASDECVGDASTNPCTEPAPIGGNNDGYVLPALTEGNDNYAVPVFDEQNYDYNGYVVPMAHAYERVSAIPPVLGVDAGAYITDC